ncbi:glycosyltransferase family 4 protein [Candidatus Parcubacteria bacterium]|nr:glycosyltransferase family 4 protein [Patescibacteria group bacterium]MBU4309147.1 glycosyltransferase family 4 protein [Patescibacteria group bacterium]MBU4432160.1 glycosyltransferase family 4 protein [Patescibacteria group bacterium]MBU4577508.1 glycosyltransferase family 4 protein [Patescibacteria group bacterium]MCG2697195.1 glycosyltransferase family 4 protein [Candidatus Parcubacteria bacterium]
MKVLLFTLEYPPFKGGVANYYENIVKHWPDQDDIFVMANFEKKIVNKKITQCCLISKLVYPKWITSIFKLFYYILKNKIDHVIVGHLLPLGTVTYLVSRFTMTDYSVVIHGMDFAFAIRRKRKKFLTKLILNNSKNIICSNNFVANMVKDFLGEVSAVKVDVVNPGINDDFKRNDALVEKIKKEYDLEDKTVLLSVGRLVKRKGFDKVVEVMSEVNKVVPNAKYVLAGKGPDEDYIKSCQKVGSDILYLDNLSDEDKWAWLALCDIFIMPSRNIDGDFEGFGIVYLEANLAGKPVIGGNSGGVADAIRGAYSGVLVDSENMENIKEAIITLATNKELCQKLGTQGRERAIAEFNWPKQIKKMYQIIN